MQDEKGKINYKEKRTGERKNIKNERKREKKTLEWRENEISKRKEEKES